jgi:hypothetical protein
MAVTKSIKHAVPTVDTASGNVVKWDVQVTFKDGDFERDYPYTKDVANLGKAPEAFTKAEVIGYAPDALDDVFAHHKDVFTGNYTPETEALNDFEFASK